MLARYVSGVIRRVQQCKSIEKIQWNRSEQEK